MAPPNTHTSKRILLALLLGCLLAVAPLAAQDRLFNRTDSLGRRSGLWRLSNSSLDSGFGYSFYYDGLKNGITIYFPGMFHGRRKDPTGIYILFRLKRVSRFGRVGILP